MRAKESIREPSICCTSMKILFAPSPPLVLPPFLSSSFSRPPVDTTLSTYIDKMMKPQSLRVKGNETFYWFGDNNYTEFASLFSAYNPPKYSLPDTLPAYSFGVAGTGTGVPFHWHGPGFAEVLERMDAYILRCHIVEEWPSIGRI